MASFHISPAVSDPVGYGLVVEVAAVLALRATSRYVPSLSGIALIAATMFSAVNSPTPRVLFGMVVSGTDGVGVLRVGGCVQGGAVELSRPLGSWFAKLVGNVLWWSVWPAVRPLRAAKRRLN